MVTYAGTQTHFADALKEIVKLNDDVIGAYDTAIDKLHNAAYKDTCRSFQEEHKKHNQDLSKMLEKQGVNPREASGMLDINFKQLITKGKVYLANIMSDSDEVILQAMADNEEEARKAYLQLIETHLNKGTTSAGSGGINVQATQASVADVVQSGLKEDEQHVAWFKEKLEALRSAS